MEEPSALKLISDLGSTAMLGVLLWWIITRGFPQLVERFDKALTRLESAFAQEAKEQRDEHERDRVMFAEQMKQERELTCKMLRHLDASQARLPGTLNEK